MNRFLLAILLTFPFVSFAQDLQLSRNGKTKIIQAGSYIEISLPAAAQEPCDECPSHTMAGQMLGYENGILRLKVKSSAEPIVSDKKKVGSQTKTYTSGDAAPVMEIPKDIILSVTKKGNKKVREGTTLRSVGAILTLLGAGHLTAWGVLKLTDDSDGDLLLALGLAEFLSGIVLGTAFPQKTFITSSLYPGNPETQKIWKLN